jgi:uncharacterized tellurite resistance protein B-like protein
MAAKMRPPEEAHVGALAEVDLRSLPETQRVAFYGTMMAIAAVDGITSADELEVIFETIHTDGLSETAKRTIWDYLIDTPELAACLDRFTNSSAQVRYTLMVSLIEIALADRILAVSEDAALLQARHALRLSQEQIEALERYLCEGGLRRIRPSTYRGAATALKHGAPVFAALSIPATVLYFSGTFSGIMLSKLTPQRSGLTMIVDVGIALLIGIVAFLCARWLLVCSTRQWTTSARQRAQLAVQNLQEAIGYLAAKTTELAPDGWSNALNQNTSTALAERLSLLQHLLAQHQAGIAAL